MYFFVTGDTGAAGTAPRRDVLHGGSTETVRDVWSLTDWAPAESGDRGGRGLWDKPLPPLKEGPQEGPLREAGPLHWNVFVKDVHSSINMWMMHLHVHTLIITRFVLMMYTLYYMLFMYASNKHLDTLCPIPLHNPEIYRLTGFIQDVSLVTLSCAFWLFNLYVVCIVDVKSLLHRNAGQGATRSYYM